jgi:hypothetical protein
LDKFDAAIEIVAAENEVIEKRGHLIFLFPGSTGHGKCAAG